MNNYPYVQKKSYCPSAKCDECLNLRPCIRLEWRVDIFQWNCEIERLCRDCAEKKYPSEHVGIEMLMKQAHKSK